MEAPPDEWRPRAAAVAEAKLRRARPGDPVLSARIEAPAEALESAWEELAARVGRGEVTSRGTAWFLDNHHVVRRAAVEVERSLGPRFERRLPRLADSGRPRVFAFARVLVEADLGHVDEVLLDESIRLLQTGVPLSTAELWALPLALRIALVEALDAAIAALVEGRDRVRADRLVANCIRSLRGLERIDWRELFERHSALERALREDPEGVYARMDFETRDRYRRKVEAIAWDTERDEVAVARAAVERCRGAEGAEAHVGHYLLGEGQEDFERALGYRRRGLERLRDALRAHPTAVYLGLVLGLFLGLEVGLVLALGPAPSTALAVLFTLIPASAVAVALTNLAITNLLPPWILPKLELDEGLRREERTLVAVPSMLTDADEVDALLAQLEVHYLGNADPELRFALLTDFTDAPRAEMPGDDALVARARQGIEHLNAKHPGARFLLLHRCRDFNEAEGCYMGWERKRGKLAELGELLLGRPREGAWTVVGAPEWLAGVRYVITLDADTRMGRGAAARLVGTLAHPLNRARFDAEGHVVHGYTLLQPRVEITPTSSTASPFARIFAGVRGLDPYTRAVSDAYQDLFGEGSFVGKGIFDVEAFQRSMQGRIPENTLLSHDLLEGLAGRAALVTDVIVFEDYPRSYLAWARRQHRWIRGDWQLLPWLFADARLSAIGRWKIVDNLRRSLEAPAMLALLLAGWTVLPGSAWAWTALALAVPVAVVGPGLCIEAIGRARPGLRPPPSAPQMSRKFADAGRRIAIELALLPHLASLAVGAIARTVYRLVVSRRKLLEWTTAAATHRLVARSSAAAVAGELVAAPVTGLLVLVGLAAAGGLAPALPFALAWLAAPVIAVALGRPSWDPVGPPDDREVRTLRRLSRRTWNYFETQVGPEHHWLPPDNVQEHPWLRVAARTSPTNIGLGLLSTVAAWDLGYLDSAHAALRLRNTLDTLAELELFRGHLYNWYDTERLIALEPRYVSSVDSGNLAGCLIAVAQAASEIEAAVVLRPARWRGLADSVAVLAEAASPLGQQAGLVRTLDRLSGLLAHPPSTVGEVVERLAELDRAAGAEGKQLIEAIGAHPELEREQVTELRRWAGELHEDIRGLRRELELFCPWHRVERPSRMPVAAAGAIEQLDRLPAIGRMTAYAERARERLAELDAAAPEGSAWRAWAEGVRAALRESEGSAASVRQGLAEVRQRAAALVDGMDFTFLYDRDRHLLRIGFDVTHDRDDPNHYDLLASEARIASVVAIAKGDVPESHWMYLGRRLGQPGAETTLLAWSGSMFEYLMAPLLLREPAETLLGQSARAAVAEQIAWGERAGVPWGVSESGYHAFDADQNYQYRAFGAPGLGFKRGLEEDVVVAPYATALAVGIAPEAALANLARLETLGAVGRYGLIEALDYTPRRVPTGQRFAPVRSWMAHHQGMALVAMANRLLDSPFVRRFHADRRIRTVELLLQESAPRRVPLEPRRPPEMPAHVRHSAVDLPAWQVREVEGLAERLALSNGRLSSVVGRGGWLQWGELALTRPEIGLHLWVDEGGTRTWIRQTERLFRAHMAERVAWVDEVAIREWVAVSPEVDVEVRLLTVANESETRREVAVGTYEEVVLGPAREDQRHPAFSKLFVESEWVPSHDALVFHRRKREASAPDVWMLRMLVHRGAAVRGVRFQTDRAACLGRHGSTEHLADARGGVGTVLDPVAVLAADLVLEPHLPVQIAQVTVAGSSREEVLERAEAFRSLAWIEWTFDMARERAELEVARLGLTPEELAPAQALLSRVLCPWHATRASASALARAESGQSALWRFSISGDLPIALFRLSSPEDVGPLRQLLRAWSLWRERGVPFDVIILGEQGASYEASLDDRVFQQIAAVGATEWIRRPGGITPLAAEQLSHRDRDALLASARVLLRADAGPIDAQLALRLRDDTRLPPMVPLREATAEDEPLPFDEVSGKNPWGGFAANGDYLVQLEPGAHTPAPWANVVANTVGFGFLVTESGGGYTWAGNAGENRLTPWCDDPVLDTPGESLYLRDEETAHVWTPTPMPAPGGGRYQVRHAPGSTRFAHRSHGLDQELLLTAAPTDPVKLVRLVLVERSGRPRRLTATFVAEWLLGVNRPRHAEHVVPELAADEQVLLARNPWSPAFPEAVAFAAASRPLHGLTGDRLELFGEPPNRARPPGLVRIGLSGTVEPGRDPCAALQVHIDLPANGRAEVVFLLGQGADREAALALAARYREAEAVEAAIRDTAYFWEERLGALQVHTPNGGMDLLVNRWLPYQSLSSRVLGRTGFYQSSGAYGFRDQLQDVTALALSDPGRWRAHLLRAAAKQFPEGDVLHWWHPPSGAGIRSRCSDDLLWLPWATAAYVGATGDVSVLDEEVRWLRGPELEEGELERYGQWEAHNEGASLFRHCLAAIERGWQLGADGLPLMGAGDWNDGMSRVGAEGKGQSVWLGWFCIAVARSFADVCERVGEEGTAADLRARAEALAESIEAVAWDGGWYQRAIFDNGTPLGTHEAEECRIDAIAQAWAVLSGAGDPERAGIALDAVEEQLVREEEGLVALLAPPFDRSEPDPGYIRGYPPGVRENGGQYTHAAMWVLWAMLERGRVDRAVELFDRITCLWHGSADTERYRVEPYVIAADIYAAAPHTGRGGWTWYTGSAAWAWRFCVEGVLGIRLVDGALHVAPKLPSHWPGFEATVRRGETTWQVRVERGEAPRFELDGEACEGGVPLVEDGERHELLVVLATGEASGRAAAV